MTYLIPNKILNELMPLSRELQVPPMKLITQLLEKQLQQQEDKVCLKEQHQQK